jgi:hypothetical protein
MQFAFILLLSSVAGLAFGLYSFFRRWRQQRLFEDTPQARIRSAPQGYVKLSGHAVPVSGKALRAPLSGRACVWWKYTVGSRGEGPGSRWCPDEWDTSTEPFLLADQADQCLVDPQGAEIEPSDRRVWYGESPRMPTFSIFGLTPLASSRTNRYTEAVILPDAQLSVLGELRTDPGSVAHSLDDEAAATLSAWKADQKTLLKRFDKNHDGRIDQDEWQQARLAARAEVQQQQLRQPPEARLNVIRQPSEGRPYLIAALPCAQLVRKEGRRALGGLALTLLCLLAACYAMAHLRL